MLFNCFNCGRSISTKKDYCVYCKADTAEFAAEFNKQRQTVGVKGIGELKEKYTGTLLSFLLRTR